MDFNQEDVTFDMLKYAVLNGSVNIIKSLLSRSSADIDRCDNRDYTLLKLAIDNEMEEAVDTLIKYGANVNNKGILDDSLFPIHIACMKGSSTIVEILLDNDADIESRNSSYLSPLYYAVKYEHIDIVELLVKRGADVNALIGWPAFYTCLHSAVETGNRYVVEFLVRNRGDCNFRQVSESDDAIATMKDDSKTPLSIAITEGYTDIALLLIDQGADVNAVVDKLTMLDMACRLGSSEMVKSLLDRGADIESRNASYLSPLYYAVHSQHIDVVELLVKRGADVNALIGWPVLYTALHSAVETGSPSIVCFLLNNEADCNSRQFSESSDDSGGLKEDDKTPLSIAIEAGYTDIALLLIDKGADVNATVDNCTMLYLAINFIKQGHQEVVKALISKRADINARSLVNVTKWLSENAQTSDDTFATAIDRTDHDVTALMTACHIGCEANVAILLENGARMNDKSRLGATPLLEALTNHRIVEMLLSRDANVDDGLYNSEPLVKSIKFGLEETTRLLLKYKANVNCAIPTNYDEKSVISYACSKGQYAIVEMLLDRDKTIINDSRRPPLHTAAAYNHADIVSLLIERGADVNIGVLMIYGKVTPLDIATFNGHQEVVRILLQSDQSDLYQSLVIAVTKGNLNILKMLLDKVSDDIERFVHELIPIALLSNQYDTIAFLLTLSPDNHISDLLNKQRSNIVFSVARNGQTEIMKLLINRGLDINVRDADGKTPLIIAATHGHFETAQLLVESGADVFAIDGEWLSASHYADVNEHTQLASYLKQCTKPSAGKQKTSYNIRNSLFEVVDVREAAELLLTEDGNIENYDGSRPLHFAARRGLVDLAQLLIDFGATVDATDSAGQTPLHEAARVGLDITRVLLNHTKRVNVQNIKGSTPLHEAVQRNQFDVVFFLMENGADPEIEDTWMNTPFHYAFFANFFKASTYSGQYSLIKRLAKCVKPNFMGISVLGRLKCYCSFLSESDKILIDCTSERYKCSDVDILGNTELHRAVGVYRSSKLYPLSADICETVTTLFKSPEVNVNARNYFGETPLHVVQDISTFKACLEKGLEDCLRTTDNYGRNIWHLLAKRDDVEQLVTLIEQVVPSLANTGIEATDAFGRNALHYAVIQNSNDQYKDWLLDKAEECSTIHDCYGKTPLDYFIRKRLVLYVYDADMKDHVREVFIPIEGSPCNFYNPSGSYRHFRMPLPSYEWRTKVKLQKDHFLSSRTLLSFGFDYVFQNLLKKEMQNLMLRKVEDEALFISGILSTHRCVYSQIEETASPSSQDPKTEYLGQSDDMFTSITEIITLFMYNLVKGVSKIDQRFQGKLVPAGSSYEGTKIDFCDEFDFIVVLERFSEIVDVIDSSASLPTGFVVLKMGAQQQEQSKSFAEFVNEENMLNTRLIKFRFETLVRQVLGELKFQKENDCFQFLNTTTEVENILYSFSADRLATNIRMKFTKPINGQEITHDVSLDIVPAINKEGYWPADAIQNIDEVLGTISAYLPRQCYLVFDQPQKKYPWVGWTLPTARVDFSVLESNIIKACHPVVREACLVVKQIVKYFCHYKLFKSYVIKAALMHCIMVRVSQNHFLHIEAPERRLIRLVQNIMRCLLCFVLQDSVPSVFMPRFVLPVCSFEPHVKFSHIRLHQSGVLSYEDLIENKLAGDKGNSKYLIDAQLEHITMAYVLSHLMYWSVLPNKTRRKLYSSPIKPLYEQDFWFETQTKALMDECFEEMKFESKRFDTFCSWPKAAVIKPSELAAAGLFYTGIDDCVLCVFCLGAIQHWQVDDVPAVQHQKRYPHCPFVRGDDTGNMPLVTEEICTAKQLLS